MATASFIADMQSVNSSPVQQQNTHVSRQQPNLSSQPSQVQTQANSTHPPVTVQEVQIPDNNSVSLTKVLVPAQVAAVVTHSFPEQQPQQQQQQQSVLFQALTSQPAPHFIALAVPPNQEGERQDVQPSQTVPCIQYVDESGGPNIYAAPNGHMTTYSVYTPTETTNMYTANSTAYYNTQNNTENYSQVIVDGSASTNSDIDSHSYSEQQDVFQSLDENSENNQVPCYPSSRLSAATMKWLMDNFELAEGMSVPRSTMYNHYLKHCNECKMEPLNAASFGKLIRSVFAGLRTRRLGTRGNSKYHYYGIRLKPSSSISKVAENNQAHPPFRNNPFTHMRRIKSENGNIENNENSEKKETLEPSEMAKRRCVTQPTQKSQHQIYLGDASFAIPTVDIELNSCSLPEGIDVESIQLFKALYRKHCESFLEAVVSFQFNVVESLWHSFWNRPTENHNPSTDISRSVLMTLCMWQPIREFVKHTDYQFYQNLVDVLIPDVLRPIPSTLTQAIRNFAKGLEGWLRAAMSECCGEIVNIKISAISAFAQTLRRYTSLNHLAQAARAVLQSTTQIKQMTADLSKVDFRNIQEQASWVCQCDDETVHRLFNEFRQTLQHHLWLEEWASWLESIVQMTLKPYEGKSSYPKAARQFLLKWSFYSSLVIRDLTLRSAASFGSFHLLRLLYDEYMFFIIEHCIARATGVTSIAVMGEYLCSGEPEELCENAELKNNKLIQTMNLDSGEILQQNGCYSEGVESSQHTSEIQVSQE